MNLSDRMLSYEEKYKHKVPISDILFIRLDGVNFSRILADTEKPFDSAITTAMVSAAAVLKDTLIADVAYVGSDEITLVFFPTEHAREYLYGGNINKLNSISASIASITFCVVCDSLNKDVGGYTLFDARTFGIPSISEASNALLARMFSVRTNARNSVKHYTNQDDMDDYLSENKHGVLITDKTEFADSFIELSHSERVQKLEKLFR